MDRWIFLSGMMGSGKSTVALEVARRAGAEAVDLDARIVAAAGKSIPEIFQAEGEAGFRARESEALERLLAERGPKVVALGGGTVLRAESRRRLLDRGVLLTLSASAEELARRVEGNADRPLLSRGETVRVVEALLAEREGVYAECHATVPTTDRDPGAIADEALRIAARPPIPVPLGTRTYRVEVGRGLLAGLHAHVAARLPGAVVLVTDENVRAPWAERAAEEVRAAGRALTTVVLTPGEEHKRIAAVERIWDAALEARIDRSGAVLAVGGGVVGDLAGFAAATLLRGIRFAQCPTSLLAMVDASVGGKTGFDRDQGKNLVGAFHQPELVLCDVDTLETLPDEEISAGLAEVVKAAWIDGEAAVAALEADADALVGRDPEALERAIRRSVTLKARVVAEDEREAGRRAVLNLGHTVGHAIEAARGYRGIRHGEAVALGMVAAFRVAGALGDADAVARGERVKALLSRLRLPIDLDAWLVDGTLDWMAHDKKRAGGRVRFVVPAAPGEVSLVPLAVERVAEAVRGG
ncbi:MAG: 3-dehydroquinate synthase [Myxococcota bacterium]|nr:3-dehydroquinate synthase [Myxococcota bacterium]